MGHRRNALIGWCHRIGLAALIALRFSPAAPAAQASGFVDTPQVIGVDAGILAARGSEVLDDSVPARAGAANWAGLPQALQEDPGSRSQAARQMCAGV